MPVDVAPLFTPFEINQITLPNRFVMPAMQRRWCHEGAPRPELGDYYRRRVEGGTALIISESVAVDHGSSTQSEQFARLNAATSDAWAQVVEKVKLAGGHIFLQLWHEGALRHEGGDGPFSDCPTLSPSGLVYAGRRNGRGATLQELAEIKHGFVRSALLAQKIGADGVEIHSCHGYLLDQFLWPATNVRDDEYGGDILSRARFPAEVVAAVRAACGPDFVISFRFSQWKEADYDARICNSPEELGSLLTTLSHAGVDLFHASTRRFWKPEWQSNDLNLAGWTKQLSSKPVITVGSVGLNIDVMETFFGELVEERLEAGLTELSRRFAMGEFDLVSIGRSLIGDPDWVNKIRDGLLDQVRVFRRDDLGSLDGALQLVAEAHRKSVPG